MNSRAKGKRAELELAKKLREYGYDCRRGQQFSGANGDADVVGLPGIHIECKRVERLDIVKAMAQSDRDARPGELPVVMHRKNNCIWLVTSQWRWQDQVGAHESWKLKEFDLGERKRIPVYYDLLTHRWLVLEYVLRDNIFPYYTMTLEDWIEIYREWECGR